MLTVAEGMGINPVEWEIDPTNFPLAACTLTVAYEFKSIPAEGVVPLWQPVQFVLKVGKTVFAKLTLVATQFPEATQELFFAPCCIHFSKDAIWVEAKGPLGGIYPVTILL